MFEERMFTIAFQILQIFLFIFVRFFLHAARKRHRLFVTIKKRQGEPLVFFGYFAVELTGASPGKVKFFYGVKFPLA